VTGTPDADRHTFRDWQAQVTRSVVDVIRARRKTLGLRVQDVTDRAAALGIDLPSGALAKLESGERRQITAAEILTFAAVLGLPSTDLLEAARLPAADEPVPAVVIWEFSVEAGMPPAALIAACDAARTAWQMPPGVTGRLVTAISGTSAARVLDAIGAATDASPTTKEHTS
jgi:transcriptional regulator with XRE-family HTH domain